MFRWFVALVIAFCAALLVGNAKAQIALPPAGSQVLKPSHSAEAAPESAWLDLRQSNPTHSKVQDAPAWV